MNIIVTGSIAYDYLMRFPGKFTEHIIEGQIHRLSVSFLVDDMSKHWGGNGANISYTLALLGMRPKVFGAVGRDFGDYRLWLERVGVDCSLVRQIDNVFTSSFFVTTDTENNQIASFYGGAMAYARHYSLADVHQQRPDMVIIAPNDPRAMNQLADECKQRGIRYVYDPSQQVPRLTGDDLRNGMDGAYAMTINAYEAEIISKKTGLTIDQMRERVEILVITQGAHGSHIYANGDLLEVDIFPPDSITDPTGVGDAYRAGLVAGIMNGISLKTAGEMGALCATYALEQVGTQSHYFTLPEFIARFRQHFDDQGQLERLRESASRQET
ncbi:MAG: carbohydrate kinase family protein [Phototrophicales bacterium]|nr:MAG: carbohydrate kinase family protein [Phototrophicales bacterium]